MKMKKKKKKKEKKDEKENVKTEVEKMIRETRDTDVSFYTRTHSGLSYSIGDVEEVLESPEG